jgi:hypothetical protein
MVAFAVRHTPLVDRLRRLSLLSLPLTLLRGELL